MSDLNPLNNELAQTIASTDRRLRQLENGNNAYYGDWQRLNLSDVTYGGQTNRISIPTLGRNFNVTDKFWFRQTEDPISYNSYFYVVDVDQAGQYIDLIPCEGGTGNITASWFTDPVLVFDRVYFSKLNNPAGFIPLSAAVFNVNIYANAGAVVLTPSSVTIGVSFLGTQVLVSLFDFGASAASSWSSFAMDLPLPLNQPDFTGGIRNTMGRQPVWIDRGGTFTAGVAYVDTYDIGGDNKIRIIVETNTGSVASGSFAIRGNITYAYDLNLFNI